MRRPFPASFLSRLEDIVGAKYVVTDSESLTQAAVDETPNGKPAMPDVVVHPGCTQEIAEVLRACTEANVYATPRGAGTGHSGGCVPVYGGLVLATDRVSRILKIDTENLIAEVEPGVILADLQQAVEEVGLFYPPDPNSASMCTLGGNVAENAGGPRALKYGVTSDFVLGLEAVLPDGTVLETGKQTVKGVAGYDLTSLLCGSEGTLAVMSKIRLKLVPLPRSVQTALVVFSSSEQAARAVAATLAAGVVPRTLEYMDRHSIEAVTRFGAPYRFPVDAGAALILETDGDDSEVAFAALSRAVEAMQKVGAMDAHVAQDEKQRRDIWQSRKQLSAATRRIKKRKVAEDVVVPRSRIPELVARHGELGEKHGLMTCAYGHAGDGNLHCQILFDDEEELPRVEALMADLFRISVEMGGSITGEHGVGYAKRDFLSLEQSPAAIDLQKRLKRVFDPAGILNPGKIFPGA